LRRIRRRRVADNNDESLRHRRRDRAALQHADEVIG
jgi:hypothetical protein